MLLSKINVKWKNSPSLFLHICVQSEYLEIHDLRWLIHEIWKKFQNKYFNFLFKKKLHKRTFNHFQPSYKMQNLPLKEFFSIRALSVKSPAKTGIGTLSSSLIKEISAHFPTTEYSFNYHSLILSLYRTFIILRTCFETFFLLSSVFSLLVKRKRDIFHPEMGKRREWATEKTDETGFDFNFQYHYIIGKN